MRYIIIFLIFFSKITHANLKCANQGINLLYINGINAEDSDEGKITIKRVYDRLKDKGNLKKIERTQNVSYDSAFNESHGLALDLIESGTSKLMQALKLNKDVAATLVYQSLYNLVSPKNLDPAVNTELSNLGKELVMKSLQNYSTDISEI